MLESEQELVELYGNSSMTININPSYLHASQQTSNYQIPKSPRNYSHFSNLSENENFASTGDDGIGATDEVILNDPMIGSIVETPFIVQCSKGEWEPGNF